MTEKHASMSSRTFSVVLAGALAVVAWRVTALVLVFQQSDPSAESLVVKTLLAGLGITFLVCGLVVFRSRPRRATLLFAGFCICDGLHWGGPLELPPGQLRTGLVLFYLRVSSFRGAALFLQFALTFPRETRLGKRKSVIRFLYAPVFLAMVMAVLYLVAPTEGALRTAAQESFFLLHAVISNLFPALALALYLSLLLRPGLTRTQKRYVGLMVSGMLIAWLPYIVAAAAGAATDPWNLTVVALPVSFAIAIFGIEDGG